MQLKPEEISKVIRSQIKYYENAIRQDETGTVLMVGDGIARVSGLANCMAGELLEFEDGSFGIASRSPDFASSFDLIFPLHLSQSDFPDHRPLHSRIGCSRFSLDSLFNEL